MKQAVCAALRRSTEATVAYIWRFPPKEFNPNPECRFGVVPQTTHLIQSARTAYQWFLSGEPVKLPRELSTILMTPEKGKRRQLVSEFIVNNAIVEARTFRSTLELADAYMRARVRLEQAILGASDDFLNEPAKHPLTQWKEGTRGEMALLFALDHEAWHRFRLYLALGGAGAVSLPVYGDWWV
jgi:hypothetical protein